MIERLVAECSGWYGNVGEAIGAVYDALAQNPVTADWRIKQRCEDQHTFTIFNDNNVPVYLLRFDWVWAGQLVCVLCQLS